MKGGKNVKTVRIEYGDTFMDINVPEHAVVVSPGETYQEPQPLEDPIKVTSDAIKNPLGMSPISKLVGPGSKVVIGFPDRVKGGFQVNSHRRVTIPLLLEELKNVGVRERDIQLICAMGLHRKNLREEFNAYLGKDLVDKFWGERLINHDSEDPKGVLYLGETDDGDVVEFNKFAIEADLTILLGHTFGNPYGGYSGGYKMPCTGLTTWRSIRCHHSPLSLYCDDFLPISTKSHFRNQLHKIGKIVEKNMKHPIFEVDAVLNGDARQIGVYAGAIDEVEKESWPIANARTEVIVPGEPADILVIGMPRAFHYGPGMGSNPIYMKQAIGASVARAFGAIKPGETVAIVASVCDGWFNDEWFPASREIYEYFQKCATVDEMVKYEDEFANRPEYIYKYRYSYAYHPFHAFSMLYFGGLADKYTQAVYIVGAKEPGYARAMGCIPMPTFEQAMKHAERFVGKSPRIIIIPALSRGGVHLKSAITNNSSYENLEEDV